MSNAIPYEEIEKHVFKVDKPFHWINRNLTVVAQGTFGLHYVYVVTEAGYNGELTENGTLIYTQRGDDVSESTV